MRIRKLIRAHPNHALSPLVARVISTVSLDHKPLISRLRKSLWPVLITWFFNFEYFSFVDFNVLRSSKFLLRTFSWISKRRIDGSIDHPCFLERVSQPEIESRLVPTRSRSYLYKLTLEDLYVEKTLERSWRASRKRSRAQMFILTRRPRDFSSAQTHSLHLQFVSDQSIYTRIYQVPCIIIIKKYISLRYIFTIKY